MMNESYTEKVAAPNSADKSSATAVVNEQRRRDRHGAKHPPQHFTSPETRRWLIEQRQRDIGNSHATQRRRVLRALRRGDVTRVELEQFGGVGHAAAQIRYLRGAGVQIDSAWVLTSDQHGATLKTKLYKLAGPIDEEVFGSADHSDRNSALLPSASRGER